jgi:hypothetical protein
MTEESGKVSSHEAVLRIKWRDPGPALFASDIVVLGTADTLHLAFYQVIAPITASMGSEDDRRRLEENGSVDAAPIAHIAIPYSKLDSLIQALIDYKQKRDKRVGGE